MIMFNSNDDHLRHHRKLRHMAKKNNNQCYAMMIMVNKQVFP